MAPIYSASGPTTLTLPLVKFYSIKNTMAFKNAMTSQDSNLFSLSLHGKHLFILSLLLKLSIKELKLKSQSIPYLRIT